MTARKRCSWSTPATKPRFVPLLPAIRGAGWAFSKSNRSNCGRFCCKQDRPFAPCLRLRRKKHERGFREQTRTGAGRRVSASRDTKIRKIRAALMNESSRHVELPEQVSTSNNTDRFAARLRGFGPIGLLAILIILVGNLVIAPLSAILVL